MDEQKVVELTKEFVRAAVELWPDGTELTSADRQAQWRAVAGMSRPTSEQAEARSRADKITEQARLDGGLWKANALRLIGDEAEEEPRRLTKDEEIVALERRIDMLVAERTEHDNFLAVVHAKLGVLDKYTDELVASLAQERAQAEEVRTERDALRGQVAAMREVLEQVQSWNDYDYVHDALASDAGKLEAEVIAAAVEFITQDCHSDGCERCTESVHCAQKPLQMAVRNLREGRGS
jgi:hypothetical protein